jgi:hypothetical protein
MREPKIEHYNTTRCLPTFNFNSEFNQQPLYTHTHTCIPLPPPPPIALIELIRAIGYLIASSLDSVSSPCSSRSRDSLS